MFNLIEVDKINYPKIFDEKIDKYLLIDEEKNIIGLATMDESLKINKIKINVLKEFQGKGYGKLLFEKMLEEYKKKNNAKELVFSVQSQSIFKRILYKFGAINVDNDEGMLKFILPLR